MEKYICSICGNIHEDPTIAGNPESGDESDTPFEELPEDWVCPYCRAPKEFYKKF